MAEPLVKFKLDVRELVQFAKRAVAVEKTASAIMANDLNDIGDQVVATMSLKVVRESGLSLEQVRGLMRVKRATRRNLVYEIKMDRAVLEDPASLEGRRENTDFGKRRPGTLVIVVSKQDELVCMDCEALAAAGPMPVEIAMAHLPVHPNCRCIIMPHVQKGKRLPVTFTTITGAVTERRARARRRPLSDDMTVRQIAQKFLDKSARNVSVSLRGL